MSLDVYLEGPKREVPCRCSRCEHEHTRQEREGFFTANITHNLTAMASEAGLYEAMWRPDEHGITTAAQLIAPLEQGLALLESDPARFEAFNPKNGWGSYAGLVRFVRAYLAACREYPEAEVYANR